MTRTLTFVPCATVVLISVLSGFWLRPAEAASFASIKSSDIGPSSVGVPVSWTLQTSSPAAGALQYSFRLTDADGALVVNRSWSSNGVFNWIPLADGSYTLTTNVRNLTTGMSEEEQMTITVIADADSASQPRVAPTTHPLVAVYSTTCDSGQVRVFYYPSGGTIGESRTTPPKPCQQGKRIAFVIGGLKPATQYVLQSQVVNGAAVSMSGTATFTTGEIPPSLHIPPLTIDSPQSAGSSSYENVNLAAFIAKYQNAVAYDNQGNVLWYYYDPFMPKTIFLRPLAGGTMFLNPTDETSLREIDLAGNVLHEINVDEASTQLAALGLPPITNFNHDAVRLPNGNTAAIAATDQIADQGNGPEVVVGDMILVLDRNWNVVWAWNPFTKLDTSRRAILDEKICLNVAACPGPAGNDWTHANSLQYLADGNFLMSLRHQDWLIKIDYRDGAGTGDVLWRMGIDGDFTTDSTDSYPWFTHQHFATLRDGELTLFDNGNTRVAHDRGNSRGQVWKVDESAHTAHPILNVDLGTYSLALGTAHRLGNGNYHFLSGYFMDSTGWRSESSEAFPAPLVDGSTIGFKFGAPSQAYRVFRMTDLYSPENVQ